MIQRNWKRWALITGVWALVGLFFATESYYARAYYGRPIAWSRAISFSLTSYLIWGLLTPPVLELARRLSQEHRPWWRLGLLHLGAGAIFSVLHLGLRLLAWPLLGMSYSQPIPLLERFMNSLVTGFYSNLLIYVSIVSISTGLTYYRRSRERALKASQLEAKLAQARLHLLTVQLQPHFLFNTLHAISTLMYRDVATADRIMAQLSDLLRLTLERVGKQQITVRQEMEFLEIYLEIEKTRFQDRLTVRVETDADTMDALLPTMILQPLVDNAIRHGIAPSSAEGRIAIRCRREGNDLAIDVQDNGCGLPANWQDLARERMGLSNTRARLEQIHGLEQKLELKNAPEGGVCVRLTVPFCTAVTREGEAEAAALANGESPAADSTSSNLLAVNGSNGSAPSEAVPGNAPLGLWEARKPNGKLGLLAKGKWMFWPAVGSGWTLLAVYFASENYIYRAYLDRPVAFPTVLGWWLAHFYLWALLTPIVLYLARRFPLDREHWQRSLAVHTLGSVALSALQLALWLPVAPLVRLIPEQPKTLWDTYKGYVVGDGHSNLLVYWMLVGLWHAVSYYRNFREHELAASRLRTGLARARLDALQMQLQPHFLFNTLHAISSLMQRDVEAANRLIARLSDLLRMTLEHAGEQEIALKQELEFLERYLEIERTRFADRLAVRIEIDPETLDARVPCLILQPLVENAVRHGIAPRAAAGEICIRAQRRNGTLQLEVRDDGVGLQGGSPQKGRGIGLGNTRARLAQLYGSAHRLEMNDVPGGGLVVSLVIPFAYQI